MTLVGEVFGKVKKVQTRSEDIFPIWDYDSGLYWTGDFASDPYHKKHYRDAGRYLQAFRKAFLPVYVNLHNNGRNKQYQQLEEFAEMVSFLQHHDGISGTSKYGVLDQYEELTLGQVQNISKGMMAEVFAEEFPEHTGEPLPNAECSLDNECILPPGVKGDILLKVFNSAAIPHHPIIVHVPEDLYFKPGCDYEVNCACHSLPCPCSLYLFPKLATYSLIRLQTVNSWAKDPNFLRELYSLSEGVLSEDKEIKYNATHFTLLQGSNEYSVGYKKLDGNPTSRNYAHLSRFGEQKKRGFNIRSGRYALGNNIATEASMSKIRKIMRL